MNGYPPPSTSAQPQANPYQTGTSPWPYNPLSDPNSLHDHKQFWDKLALGAKAGIISSIIFSMVILIVLSVWYCCGCCGLRRAHTRRKEILHPRSDIDTVPLRHRQLTTMPTMTTVPTRSTIASVPSPTIPMPEAPPPLYTEVTPPQHTFIAGGITHVRDEEEGIISDGKTPLSEIPFEDVVLDHNTPASSTSARNFGNSHFGLGGDTTGHTNS